MSNFKKNQNVNFAYGMEYDGSFDWKVVSVDHKYCGDNATRYTITNGTSTVSGVREKDLEAVATA